MNIFLDSSVMAKRYIKEIGTDKINSLCSEADSIFVSIICLPEILSGLNRLKRENLISNPQYNEIKKRIINDFKDMTIYDLTSKIIVSSIKLLEDNTLRAMDSLHVACALETKPDLFISSDIRQIKAAKNSKLNVLQI